MQSNLYVAGYQCQIGENSYIGIGEDIDPDQAYQSAEVNCQNSLTLRKNPAGKADSSSNNNYNLGETYSKIGSNLYYCATVGYTMRYQSLVNSHNIQSLISSHSITHYKGTIGFGDNEAIAQAQLKSKLDFGNGAAMRCGEVVVGGTVKKMNSTLTKPVMTMSYSTNPKQFINGTINDIEYKGSDVKYTCWYSNNPGGQYIEVTDGSCIIADEYSFVIHPNLLKDKGWISIQAQRVSGFKGDGVDETKPLSVLSEPKFFGCNNPNDVNCTTKNIPNPPAPNDPATNSKLITPRIKIISYRKNSLRYGIINGLDTSGSEVKYSCVTMEDGKLPVDTDCIITPEQQDTMNFSIPGTSLEGKYIAIKAQRVHEVSTDGVDPNNPITKISNKILLKFEDVNDCTYSDKINSLQGTFCYSPPRPACTAPVAPDFKVFFSQRDWQFVANFKSSRNETTALKLLKYDNTPVYITNEGSGYFHALDIVNKNDTSPYFDYTAYNVCEKNQVSPPCAIRVYKDSNRKPDVCRNMAK